MTTGPKAPSTATLLDRARAGHEDAVAALHRRYLRPFQRWAHGRLPPWARGELDTDTLVHDTLLRSLQELADLDPHRTGAFLSSLRRRIDERVREEVNKIERHRAPTASGRGIERAIPSLVEEVVGASELEAYERALEKLSPLDREAILARLDLDLSYAQIAQLLGEPTPNASRTTVAHALVRLARLMQHK